MELPTNGMQHVPDLSLPKTVRIGRDYHALVRHLDADGTLEVAVRQTPNGLVGFPSRDQLLDGEEFADLVAERMRPVIREEIERALGQEKGRSD